TVAVSGRTRDTLVTHWGIARSRILVVPNGIDTERIRITASARTRARAAYGFDQATRVVLAAGRLVPGKRFHVLVRAVALLPDSVHLVVAGQGPEHDGLGRLARQLGVSERVHLTGEVPDVLPVLAAGDVFASASVVETYGLAVVEAYLAGLPVV